MADLDQQALTYAWMRYVRMSMGSPTTGFPDGMNNPGGFKADIARAILAERERQAALIKELETERDAARQHGKEARIRELRAEDARVSAVDRAAAAELRERERCARIAEAFETAAASHGDAAWGEAHIARAIAKAIRGQR